MTATRTLTTRLDLDEGDDTTGSADWVDSTLPSLYGAVRRPRSPPQVRVLLELIPTAAYTCDLHGLITGFNRRAVEAWGREPRLNDPNERYCGSFKILTVDGIVIPHDSCWMAIALREKRGFDGQQVVVERPDGSRRTVLAHANPLYDESGQMVGAVNIFLDVTDRKRAEDALSESEMRFRRLFQTAQNGILILEAKTGTVLDVNAFMCGLVSQAPHEIIGKTLDEIGMQKDAVLAMLSHELRNPLAPIRSATHILKLQASASPLQQHACDIIERQVAHLTRLVGDLTEVSRVATGKIRLDLEPVDLCWVIRSALDTVRPLVASQRHELSLVTADAPLWVSADATRLEQIAINLLTNAAKFTDAGGRIAVSVQQEEKQAVLRVQDSGIGIGPDMLAHVFDLFAQADRSLARSQGGLGIGLSLVQRLVALQGGTVEARSGGPNQGSEFIVRLPVVLVPSEPAEPNPPSRNDRGASSVRVLVVDDNEDGCTMLAEIVRSQGYAVQTAFTGPAALAAVEAWRPDAVLLDIGLPEIDGFEVARRVRADPANKDTRVIAISGYSSVRDIELGREAGFDGHLVKPVELVEVEKLLASLDQAR